jgi:LysR family transcriptional regulator, glycine cleavage system transcriptional activator
MARGFPPLTALRTFEAVARRGVAGAAAELNVTPAAISHQIRVLEAELGVTLFTRSKRGLSLNLVGTRYLTDVAAGFDTIMAGTRRLTNPERTDRLVVDSLTSFANDVIIPRLGRLYRRNSKFELEVITLGRPFTPPDFSRTSAHAAIRGGAVEGEWPDFIAEKLAHEVFYPVCAPSLMHGPRAVRDPADLARHPLIAVSSTPEGWPQWLAAARAKGLDVEGVDPDQPIRFDTIHSATLAAMEGIGIGLGRGPLVDNAIAAGRLVEPFDLRVVSTHAYWLVYPESSRELPAFQIFRQWLFDELPPLPQR